MRTEEWLALVAPDAFFPALGLAAMLTLGLIAMGSGAVAVLTAVSFRKTSKVFADKLAKQMAEFGMLVLGAALLLISARWALWIGEIWPVSPAWQRFYQLFFDIPGHVSMLATLGTIVFARAWKRKKKSSLSHSVLGGLSCLAWMAALMLFVVGWLASGHDNGMMVQKMDIQIMPMLLLEPLAWLIWAQGLFLGMALAGGAGLLYLVLRRSREDYGRDYYAWAARTCAGRALSSGVVHVFWAVGTYMALNLPWAELAVQGSAQWPHEIFQQLTMSPTLPGMLLFLVFSLLAWLSLVPLIKSQRPMRLKGLMVAHFLLMLFALTMLTIMFQAVFMVQA